jgi:hypothetical protein
MMALSGVQAHKRVANFAHDFFVALRCIASRELKNSSWEQLRAGLRRKEVFLLMLLRHDSAALARGARVGLTAKSCPDTCFVVLRQLKTMASFCEGMGPRPDDFSLE